MTERRKVITVLLGSLVVCALGRADMMPLGLAEALGRQPVQAGTSADCHPAGLPSAWPDIPDLAGLDSSPVGFLPLPDPEAGQIDETKPAQILVDRQRSLTLCLYALLSVGLYQSAPSVKRLRFNCVADWYHSGRPFQIGPSFALSPDCLSPTPTHCFIQPDSAAAREDTLLRFRWGIVVSLWRQSQFTPATLASRGPPSMS